MNIKILAQNIVNNPSDFTAEQIEKYFEDYAKLRLFAVIKSVCEHDYMQRGGAVKYYRCVKCGNEKI